MYYKMIYMLAAVLLLIKSHSSNRITKALAYTDQKPRTSFNGEDVIVVKQVQSRGTDSKPRIEKEEEKVGNTGWNYVHFMLPSRFRSLTSIRSGLFQYD